MYMWLELVAQSSGTAESNGILSSGIFWGLVIQTIALLVAIFSIKSSNSDSAETLRQLKKSLEEEKQQTARLAEAVEAQRLAAAAQHEQATKYHEREMLSETIREIRRLSTRNADARGKMRRAFKTGRIEPEAAIKLIDESDKKEELPASGAPNKAQLEHMQAVEVRTSIRQFLNDLERLAVGVRSGVYDLDTVKSLTGGVVIAQYTRTEAYITEIRRRTGRPKAYEHLEWLAETLRQIEKGVIPPPKPRIGVDPDIPNT